MKKVALHVAVLIAAATAVSGCASEAYNRRVLEYRSTWTRLEAECRSLQDVVSRGMCMNRGFRAVAGIVWPSGLPANTARVIEEHAKVFEEPRGLLTAADVEQRGRTYEGLLANMIKAEFDSSRASAESQDRALATMALIGVMAAKGASAKSALPSRIEHNAPSKPEKPDKPEVPTGKAGDQKMPPKDLGTQ